MPGEYGTCGFCGVGDGHLGETGDESSQHLNSSIKKEDGTYKKHPNAFGEYGQTITWCGGCLGGLKHKYERYDDTNLRAKLISSQIRLDMDGLRWSLWDAKASGVDITPYIDDTSVHMEKLNIERGIRDMQAETWRRAGIDLTKEGWRE